MKQVLVALLAYIVVAQCQVHIANDNYFLEKQRLKRAAETTTCVNGMPTATRNIFVQSVAKGNTWDCTLETKAEAVIKECLTDNGGVTDGTLKLSFPVTGTTTPEAIIQQFQTALQLASSNSNSKTQVAEAIGCSYAKCDQRVDILCLYSRSSTVPPLP